MQQRKFLWIGVLLAAAIAGVVAWYLVAGFAGNKKDAALAQLLALPLKDDAGQPIASGAWRGRPLVLNFWATWCPPCREEMPLLNRMAQANPQVQFVGLSVDQADAVSAYRKQHPTAYPLPVVGLELTSLVGELGNAAMALPFTVFVSAEGRVTRVKLGELKEADLTTALAALQTGAPAK